MSGARPDTGPLRRILIVAGEASGDRYGAHLMRAIRTLAPGTAFTGVGGPAMREAGLDPLASAESIGVVGFVEVLSSLPEIRRAFDRCVEAMKRPLDLVLLIDYPGFNLRLARRAKEAGHDVVYFVSPQVWAWKPGRVRTIAETVRRMLVIFPFEEAFYRERGVAADFVGHPLVDLLDREGPRLSREAAARRFGLDPGRRIVGLLPGSRTKEATRNLPPMLEAARLLARRFDGLQFLVPVAPTLSREWLAGRCASLPGAALASGDFYEAVSLCEAAVVASGTATVEVGLLQVPMVVTYRLNPVTYRLARRMTSLRTFAMVNLIAGRTIVPELIQADGTPDRIADAVGGFLSDQVLAERTRRDLRAMADRLGGPGAFDRAARIVADCLRERGGAGRPPAPAEPPA